MMIYFVIFIIVGTFFTLNLFIGVIIDSFKEKKKILGRMFLNEFEIITLKIFWLMLILDVDTPLDVFMTKHQRLYYQTMRRAGKQLKNKSLKRPSVDYIF